MTSGIDKLVALAEEYLTLTTYDQDPSKNLPGAELATELGEAIANYKTAAPDTSGGEPVFRTKSGRVLTDADIQALADEAERGYDVTKLQQQRSDKRSYEPDFKREKKKKP